MWGGGAPLTAAPPLEPKQRGKHDGVHRDSEQDILVKAWLLAREGKGQVLEAWADPTRNELADAGWLERRTVDATGDTCWFWTHAGRGGARHERATPRRTGGHELMLQSRPSKHGHRPPLAGVPRGEDHPCRAWATGAEAAERARPCRSGVSPSPRRSGRVPVAPRSKPRGSLLVIRLLAGGREAAEVPSGQPDLLTPLECLRGRTECPKAGNSRIAVFRGSRPQTQGGACTASTQAPAKSPIDAT